MNFEHMFMGAVPNKPKFHAWKNIEVNNKNNPCTLYMKSHSYDRSVRVNGLKTARWTLKCEGRHVLERNHILTKEYSTSVIKSKWYSDFAVIPVKTRKEEYI